MDGGRGPLVHAEEPVYVLVYKLCTFAAVRTYVAVCCLVTELSKYHGLFFPATKMSRLSFGNTCIM
jgi:hypothetical protein